MRDKSLVKKRFEKSLKTYNDNAIIQKYMAEKLIALLPRKSFASIFEIGCATGILTELISEKLEFKEFTGNDLVEKSKDYIDKIIPENTFISGDIEETELKQKYDLIISNAALQWCENTEKTIEKLMKNLNKGGVLAVSVFGSGNLKEIKSILNLQFLPDINSEGIKEEKKLFFDTPFDVLKHIKGTGANAVTEFRFTKSLLKEFTDCYQKLYSDNGRVYLTYEPLYIIKCVN